MLGGEFHDQIMPILDGLVLSKLPRRAHVIDLCCGTGRLAAKMKDVGFVVTGVDASAEMLRFAEQRAVGCTFIHSDARTFASEHPADAIVSTFDSLNHVRSAAELGAEADGH